MAQAVLNALDYNIKLLVQRAVEAEREECAKVCEHYTDSGGVEYDDYAGHGYRIAAAIRGRT